jgi:hypothetical protein
MSDIFDKITDSFVNRKADRTVQINTGYVQGLDQYGPGNYTDIIDDLDDEFYQEFEGFEREANEYEAGMNLEGRLPSREHHPDEVVDKAWQKHLEKHPEMVEYVGKIQDVKEDMDKAATDYDLGLRLADHGSHSGSYMSLQNLEEMQDALEVVADMVHEGEELDDWVEDKISHAHQLIRDLAGYFGYGRGRHEHIKNPSKNNF